jgi:hypothetical protein
VPARIGADVDRDRPGGKHVAHDLAQLGLVGTKQTDMPADRQSKARYKKAAVANQTHFGKGRQFVRRRQQAHQPLEAGRLAETVADPGQNFDAPPPGCNHAWPGC